ncbi:hypothetical protein E2C01_000259 [Portunus trituberculatus]|uniref:Uncharacterized protein n=1 Tax=Portunus trituberculatus TaxID=210409 RepID=A0A5B7CEG2_PORTR|nr:hypothetical protein [Portunus trituberculatus]
MKAETWRCSLARRFLPNKGIFRVSSLPEHFFVARRRCIFLTCHHREKPTINMPPLPPTPPPGLPAPHVPARDGLLLVDGEQRVTRHSPRVITPNFINYWVYVEYCRAARITQRR